MWYERLHKTRYDRMIDRALGNISPRAQYQRDVLTGRQYWSGSDLRGEANRWGASYARARESAMSALIAAGGTTVYHRQKNGLKIGALPVLWDDARTITDYERLSIRQRLSLAKGAYYTSVAIPVAYQTAEGYVVATDEPGRVVNATQVCIRNGKVISAK